MFSNLIVRDGERITAEDEQASRDIHDLVDELQERLRRAEHYVVRRFPHTSISPLTPSDISKARVEAREDVDEILELFSKGAA